MKDSAGIYESSGSQFFRTTTVIQSRLEASSKWFHSEMFFDESDHKFKKNYFYKELCFLNFKPVLSILC